MKPEADKKHWDSMMDSLKNPERRKDAVKFEKKMARKDMKIRDTGLYE
jgi:hypothetical protein|tara:strand:- start:25627 stop:25770 length:144 start_codon:yes stop_codon:yes gene_type:complete